MRPTAGLPPSEPNFVRLYNLETPLKLLIKIVKSYSKFISGDRIRKVTQ